MTIYVRIANDRLLRVLINHLYPNGNINLLLNHTLRSMDHGLEVSVDIDLPDDHWAFTNVEEPKTAYYVTWDQRRPEVIHRRSMHIIGQFTLRRDALDYAAFLNNCLEKES